MSLLGLFSKPLKPISEPHTAGTEHQKNISKKRNAEISSEREETIKKKFPLVQNQDNKQSKTSPKNTQKSFNNKKKFKRKAKNNFKKYKKYIIGDKDENLDECLKSWLSFKKNKTNNDEDKTNICINHPISSATTANSINENSTSTNPEHDMTNANITNNQNYSLNNQYLSDANLVIELNESPDDTISNNKQENNWNITNAHKTSTNNINNNNENNNTTTNNNNKSSGNKNENSNKLFSTNSIENSHTNNQTHYVSTRQTNTIINNTNNDIIIDNNINDKEDKYERSLDKRTKNDNISDKHHSNNHDLNVDHNNSVGIKDNSNNNNNKNNNVNNNNNETSNNERNNNKKPNNNSNDTRPNGYNRSLVSYDDDMFASDDVSQAEKEVGGGRNDMRNDKGSMFCDKNRNNFKNSSQNCWNNNRNKRKNKKNNKKNNKNNNNDKNKNSINNINNQKNDTSNNIISQNLNLIRFANETMQVSTEFTKDPTKTHRKYLKPIKKHKNISNNNNDNNVNINNIPNNNINNTSNNINNNSNNKYNNNININTPNNGNNCSLIHSTPPQGYIDTLVTATESMQEDHVKETQGKDKRKRKRKRNTAYMEKKKQMSQEAVRKRAPCKFYVNGCCNKGDTCTFSHDVKQVRKAQVCKFYVMHKCTKEDCLYYHHDWPCKFFHTKGMCYNKDKCKFSHLPLNDITQEILKKILEEDAKAPKTPEPSNNQPNPNQLTNNPTPILTPSFLPVWNPQPIYVNPNVEFVLIPIEATQSSGDGNVDSNDGDVSGNIIPGDNTVLVDITDNNKDIGAFQTNLHGNADKNHNSINDLLKKASDDNDPRLNKSSYTRSLQLRSATANIPLVSSCPSPSVEAPYVISADPFKLYH